jgi:molybdopterin-guanine dinucleotide biosynthesis protein A
MGRDKALLQIDGRTLLQRTIEVLGDLSDDIVIVGRRRLPGTAAGSSERLPPAIRVHPDAFPDQGPLGGLLTGLERACGRYVVCVACDMPFLQASALRLLTRLVTGFEAAVPLVAGRSHPLHAVYDRSISGHLARSLAAGERRVRSFSDALNVRWVEEAELRAVDPELRSIQNVNTPQEWTAALVYSNPCSLYLRDSST